MTSEPSHLQKLAQAGELLFTGDVRKQYAAICYRREAAEEYEMLIVTGRKSGRWVLPRGWPMDGKSPHKVAAREAFEEAGIRGKAGKKPVGYYTYAKRLDDGRVAPCMVEVFALSVEKVVKNFPEQSQRQLRWVSFTEAQNLVDEPELRSLILNFGAGLIRRG
ncbi:MAG: NUDIX hydrolase [Rhizobiaceae bacterium]|nr:MAG: NUDIX hydrolase [Rhizobiaceae bacterium]